MHYGNSSVSSPNSDNDSFPAIRKRSPLCADSLGVKQAGLPEARRGSWDELDTKQQLWAKSE